MDRDPDTYKWGVHFAAVDLPGRNGIKRGEQYPSQDRFVIRHLAPGPHDLAQPFSELPHVTTLHFPSRALADQAIAGRMDLVRARQLLKDAEAKMVGAGASA
jgi:hypothetical protein